MVLTAPVVPTNNSTRTAAGVLDETVYALQVIETGKLMMRQDFTYIWFREDLAKRALSRYNNMTYNRRYRQPRYRIVKLALIELER